MKYLSPSHYNQREILLLAAEDKRELCASHFFTACKRSTGRLDVRLSSSEEHINGFENGFFSWRGTVDGILILLKPMVVHKCCCRAKRHLLTTITSMIPPRTHSTPSYRNSLDSRQIPYPCDRIVPPRSSISKRYPSLRHYSYQIAHCTCSCQRREGT